MTSFKSKIIGVSAAACLLGVIAFTYQNCSSDSSDGSAPGAQSVPQAVNLSISQIEDYGVQNGVIQLEVDGVFTGSGDTLTVTCTNVSSPQFTLTSDTANQILFTMTPVDDDCSVTVQNAGNVSNSQSFAVTSTQNAIGILHASDAGADQDSGTFVDS